MARVALLLAISRGTSVPGPAFQSVLPQSHGDWELLVSATDGSAEPESLRSLRRRDCRIRWVEPRARGVVAARRVCLAATDAPLIAPACIRRCFYRERLEVLAPAALKYGLALDNLAVVDATGRRILGTAFPESSRLRWLGPAALLNPGVAPAGLFRRDLAGSRWVWHEEPVAGADPDLPVYRRLMQELSHIPLLQNVLHEYRLDPDQAVPRGLRGEVLAAPVSVPG